MLRRRGVIARWELLNSAPAQCDVGQTFEQAVTAAQSDPGALVYGDDFAMSIDGRNPGWSVEFRFMTLRGSDNFPAAYNPASGITPLRVPKGSFIADVMHVVFRSDGLLIFDRHNEGPALGELSQYLRSHLKMPVAIVSLYNRDLAADIEDMQGQFRKIDIGFLTDSVDEGSPGLLSGAKQLFRGQHVPALGISMGMGRTGARDEYLSPGLQEEMMGIAGQAGELVERMTISGRRRSTGKIDQINLLRQRIGEHLDFAPVQPGSSMPDSTDAYQQLKRMFTDYWAKGIVDSALSARFLAGNG